MIDDEQVMIYILNEILDAEQMADIFKNDDGIRRHCTIGCLTNLLFFWAQWTNTP